MGGGWVVKKICVCFIDSSTIDMGNISFVLFFIAFIETLLSKALLICDGMGFLGGHFWGLAGGQDSS